MSENRYNIIKLLGKGRICEVYEAHDAKLQLKVALRRFLNDGVVIDFSDHKEEFSEVTQSLCNLQHPNLLKIFDAGVEENEAYIVSQLLEGESLHVAIKRGPLHFTAVGQLARQMLDALSLVHDQGYYHGALTADSVLMTPRARGGHRYVILDMGLSGLSKLAPLIQDGDTVLTLMGDPAIYAPELFDGEQADERSDLYMLGQLLYMCLAGHHPYSNVSREESKELHLKGLPPITEFNQEVPEDFVEWISKLTAIDSSARFSSSVEALQALPEIALPPFIPQETVVKPEATAEVAQEGASAVQANPIKRNTAPIPAKVATSPVPILAPGTAPVAITAPTGITPVTSPVPVMAPGTETGAVAVSGGAISNVTSSQTLPIEQALTGDVHVQPEKKKTTLGILIGVSSIVVVGIISALMIMSGGDDISSSSGLDDDTNLITYYDGRSGQNEGWEFRSPAEHKLHSEGLGWIIKDTSRSSFPGVSFSLESSSKKMFEKGWRLTYRVTPFADSHRIGFIIGEEINPGWLDGGSVGFCLVIKSEGDRIHFYSPQNESYSMEIDRFHSIESRSGGKELSVITIEQLPLARSGEYIVKLDGKEIFRNNLTKHIKYQGYEEWVNYLFSSALDKKSKPYWLIRDINLETL